MLSSLKLTSKTIIGKQQSKKIKNILQSLITSNDSIQFRNPVDWKNLGLLDYAYLIKNPMDLSTVSNKFNEDKYLYVQQILDDIQLIWDNCKSYNPQNTKQWIYNLAQKLERSFKKMVKNYLPNIAIIVPGRNNNNILTKQDKKLSLVSITGQGQGQEDQKQQISYNQKLKLSDKLKLLSPYDLGYIVQEIIQKCPSAFKETNDQNAELILDNLDQKTLKEIKNLIENVMANGEDKVVKRLKLQ